MYFVFNLYTSGTHIFIESHLTIKVTLKSCSQLDRLEWIDSEARRRDDNDCVGGGGGGTAAYHYSGCGRRIHSHLDLDQCDVNSGK